ncbi:unnamed protein product [Owenia fusiformis]|uniref:Uncharacterized protein n=1 Tax=Owenia fusiformis TaxID=6347 RepID=A0A8J1T9Q5_OWEFU|nr:unnamed protein product [Owenia fusiformis]
MNAMCHFGGLLVVLSLVWQSRAARYEHMRLFKWREFEVDGIFETNGDKSYVESLNDAIDEVNPFLNDAIRKLDHWIAVNEKVENIQYYLEEGLKHFDTIGKIENAIRLVMKGRLSAVEPNLAWSYGMCLYGVCSSNVNFQVKFVSGNGLRVAATVDRAFMFSYIPIKVSASGSLTIGEKYKLKAGPLDFRIPLIRTYVRAYASLGHDGVVVDGEMEVFGGGLARGGFRGSIDNTGLKVSGRFEALGTGLEVDAQASWTDGLEAKVSLTIPMIGTFDLSLRIPNPFSWLWSGSSHRYLN